MVRENEFTAYGGLARRGESDLLLVAGTWVLVS
jgi:hypothetical protein